MHDYRSVSTSTTTSNASAASTLSTISSVSSVSSTSAMSTETIKAPKSSKSRVNTAQKPPSKVQEPQSEVTIVPKKIKSDKLLPAKQKKDVVAKPVTKPVATKVEGQPLKDNALGKPTTSKAPLPKKINPVTKQSTGTAAVSRPSEPDQAKPAKVIAQKVTAEDTSIKAPPPKKTVLKPKPAGKVPIQVSNASVQAPSMPSGRKVTETLQQVSEIAVSKTPAGKKSKIIKPSATVTKTETKPQAISSSVPASVSIPTSAAVTAARTAASTPAKATSIAAKPAAKRTVSAPVPPTPKAANPPKLIPISTTPAPIRTLRPQTERPSARRKSVSFRSPLEAFQIIPARRASASPPKSSSRRRSISSTVVPSITSTTRPEPTRPATTPLLQLTPLTSVAEETARSPPAPTVEDCDDDDLVFQDEVIEVDLTTPSISTANELEPLTEEPEAEAEAETKVEAEAEADLEADLEAKTQDEENHPGEVPEPAELEEQDTETKRPPRPQTPWAPAADDRDELEDDEPVFDHSEVAPIDTVLATDVDPEVDDSTVFYDVDESYIPQYSSPRKPGTPRSRLATPGSARRTKLGMEPILADSPKLDLLKLSSASKRKKIKKEKTRSAPDLRMAADLSVKSPLMEEVVA